MSDSRPAPVQKFRIVFDEGEMVGPGKAELLERIRESGSIAAAGRAMGMSYKRAWQLVETMNAMFRTPLVVRARGGAQGGGASLTETGAAVLAAYRDYETAARAAGQPHVDRLTALLRSRNESV
ncbi:winged helix-turn-helix domain-containing protein [Ruegeria marina]|uniref:Molybdate transport system regulatory protein n=1 Tax=Ruegeria marina TaxID=639004 RepID=A0A1G7BKT6_9RHOB|nr:LysR family transcriptional regulator [Ruegeria marina]SDE27721.1 molybdate transport system regulatory protein [Ruegeria marina]